MHGVLRRLTTWWSLCRLRTPRTLHYHRRGGLAALRTAVASASTRYRPCHPPTRDGAGHGGVVGYAARIKTTTWSACGVPDHPAARRTPHAQAPLSTPGSPPPAPSPRPRPPPRTPRAAATPAPPPAPP